MNWLAFLVLAWIALGLENGLRDALQLGQSGVAPSFVMTLLAFIAASGSRLAALWGAVALGLALDLTHARPAPGGVDDVVIVGPWTLGCFVACYAAVTMRALVARRSAPAIAFLAVLVAAMAGVVATALFVVRSWYDPSVGASPVNELLVRLGSALYTGALALVLAPALLFLSGLCGFPHSSQGRERRWRV